MSTKPKKLIAYTDGACSGNPGPGGWAVVVTEGENERQVYGYEIDTTNNRMELMAVLEAATLACFLEMPMDIHSDSAYVVNAIKEQWTKRWSLNGWKTKEGTPVKNKELWIKLDKLLRSNKGISLIKVKGHDGDPQNEKADAIARSERDKAKSKATVFNIMGDHSSKQKLSGVESQVSY